MEFEVGGRHFTLGDEVALLGVVEKMQKSEASKKPKDTSVVTIPETIITADLFAGFIAWLKHRFEHPYVAVSSSERKVYIQDDFELNYTKLRISEIVKLSNFANYIDCELAKNMFSSMIAERIRHDGLAQFERELASDYESLAADDLQSLANESPSLPALAEDD